MNTLLSQDSFDRYARLVRSLIPDAAGLALCDSKGKTIYHQIFDNAEILPAIEQLCNRHPDWVSSLQCCQLQAVPGDGTFPVYRRPVRCAGRAGRGTRGIATRNYAAG